MKSKLAVCILGLALGACAEPRASGPPPSQSTGKPVEPGGPEGAGGVTAGAPVAAAVPDAGATAPAPVGWVDAVRFERWAEAAAMIDALPEAVRGRPEVRYARARAALALRDHARAVELLYQLEAALPLLAGDVARYRAEAALEAGPFAEAAAYFARSRAALDLARAADAYGKAGDTAKAIATAGQAVAASQRGKRRPDEAAARMARARALRAPRPGVPEAVLAMQPVAIADLRWVAKNAAGTADGREATAALAALKLPLSTPDRLEAVEAMIAAGSAAEAAAELDKLGALGVIPRGDLLHRRATALYKARDYEAAAKAYLEAAAVPTARQPEQLYHAARALSRSDRDAEAVERYLEVAAKYPRTSWGEGGSFLAARLLMQVGRYDEAAKQYERFLGRYPRSDKRGDAEYERALSLLSSGDADGARRRLGALAAKARAEEGSRLRQLEGLAARRAGDREGAVRIWSDVMRERPLSWAALMARARLAAEGVAPPPLLEPPAQRGFAPVEVQLPPVAALLASVGLDGDAEGWLTANERELSRAYPGREGEALCQMYGMLSRAARRYRVGARAVAYEELKRAPSADDRWAWECIYPRPYVASIRVLEEQHGLPRGLVHALMRQESAFDPVIVSPARAVGLMQLMPTTASSAAKEIELGFDPLDLLTSPEVNLRLGGFYIGKLLRTFQGSLPLAAAAYNAGPKAVSHWLEAGADRDTDLWVARIPYDETRNYVGRVLANLARYQWLEGGDDAVAMVPLEIPSDARASADAY